MSEDPKEKKLEELKKQYEEKQEAMRKEFELESRMQLLLKKTLTDEALERLNNVKLVNRELYTKTFQAVMTMVQKGYVSRKLSEDEIKQVLMQLKNDREITIRRK